MGVILLSIIFCLKVSKMIKDFIEDIKMYTVRKLSLQLTFLLVIYHVVLCFCTVYQTSKINHNFSFYYIVSYLIFIIAFEFVYFFYSLWRSKQFFDVDLFWVALLGSALYYLF